MAGSATKLNQLKGVSRVMYATAEELTTLADVVFPKGVQIVFPDGKTYRADGVLTLENLVPVIDQVMTATEKAALAAAYSTGTYVAAANGVVQHGADGKIANTSLGILDVTGFVLDAHLDFIGADGLIKLEALPSQAKLGVKFFATYADLVAAEDAESRGSICYVVDATGDATVDAGSAVYVWDSTNEVWLKVSEFESMDIDIDALRPTFENVEAANAVMYTHPLQIDALTLTEYDALVNPAP